VGSEYAPLFFIKGEEMNVSQVISIFDEERPNAIKVDTKMRWLKEIEEKILKNIVLTHELPKDENGEEKDFSNYFEEWGQTFELYVPEQYIDVYKFYLEQKTCMVEHEIADYNIASSLFNASYLEYSQYYNRNNYPNQAKLKVLDHSRS
jgi:hypothetical protein